MPVNGWEFILLIALAFVILGPQRMPEYAAKFARFVVQARRMARDAKSQLKEQMGPDYEDLDWRQYDPRQYDPRRIVREALMEPLEDALSLEDRPRGASSGRLPAATDSVGSHAFGADPTNTDSTNTGETQTPWDREAT